MNYDEIIKDTETAVTPDELAKLAELASNAKAITEIGSWKGGSTIVMAKSTQGVVEAVDPWFRKGIYNVFWENMKKYKVDNFTVLRKTSWAANLKKHPEIDLLFIDGAHDYWNVKYDSMAFGRLVKVGGVIAFHDSDKKGVGKVIKSLEGYGNFSVVGTLAYAVKLEQCKMPNLRLVRLLAFIRSQYSIWKYRITKK